MTLDQAVEAEMLSMLVRSKAEIARGTFLFELASLDPSVVLPPFTAGSHVTVLTPCGLTRRYSLCNAPSERGRYLIAVKRETPGLGGSASMVDDVNPGDRIPVSHPKNDFALEPNAASFIFIAGGIGITPIMSMMAEAKDKGLGFKLVYCTRDAESTAFLDQLSRPGWAEHTLLHHDHGERAKSFDLAGLLALPVPGAHIYCCGPTPLMRAVRDLTRHWPHATAHFEDFGVPAKPASAPSDVAQFTVKLARKGISVGVPAGQSILDALRAKGVAVPSSCESGTCGTCRTGLLAGEAEHRDFVLDEDEYGTQIMICVSRAKSQELLLDI